MKNGKLRRLGGLLALLLVLTCLLSMSAFAGEGEERYGYSTLTNEKQKLVYSALKAAVAEAHETAELSFDWKIDPDTDIELMYEVLRVFAADYPEYYWFIGNADSFGTTSHDGKNFITKINLSYDTTYNILCCEDCGFYTEDATECSHSHCIFGEENPDKTDLEQTVFEKEVKKLLADCPKDGKDGSEYEKALYIHDALAKHIEYSYDYQYEQSAYSAIVDGKAVCAGYARAYQYLLNRVGIDAWTVEGFGWNPQDGLLESHAWNLVWIDGECVYTDVTWDDQDDPGRIGQIMYAYFNRSLADISKDHMTDSVYVPDWVDYFGDKLPTECDHTDKTYFAQNDIGEIDEISVDTLAEHVKQVDDYQYAIHVVYDKFNYAAFRNWMVANSTNLIKATSGDTEIDTFWVSGLSFTGMGDEIRIVINADYKGLDYFDGRVDSVEDETLTAYVCYWQSALENDPEKEADEADYETVMVAYYDKNDALVEVAFTELYLDSACRAELTADCPDEFAYCRVFVVGSKDNPSPVCDLLQMSMPK